jgi:hypothetical protein
MNVNKSMVAGSLMLGGILAFSLYGIGSSLASGRFEHEYEGHEREYEREHDDERKYWRAVRPSPQDQAQYERYREECGACHMAYPPSLLPAQSWQAIMGGLEDHFGENAELDASSTVQIDDFLQRRSSPGNSGRMLRNLGNAAPLRITELPHFRHEHDEIPAAFVRGNDKVASLSQCNACHQQAERGWFDEDSVSIPGVGRWHD